MPSGNTARIVSGGASVKHRDRVPVFVRLFDTAQEWVAPKARLLGRGSC